MHPVCYAISMRGLPLERNPNWKGGRVIEPRGYVLIKNPEHPRADVRGYVYEHVLVAEKALGRPLRRGELVHHINGENGDNQPENLEVLPSRFHHSVAHRRVQKQNRLPGEPNPTIRCACVCGDQLKRFDNWGRPRSFISGHNVRRNRLGQF